MLPKSTDTASISTAWDDFKEHPLVQEWFRAGAELLLFDYTGEQWMEIAHSIQHFLQKPDAWEKALSKLRNSARSYFLAILNRPGTELRKKELLKHWTKTRDLADALMSEFKWLANDKLNDGPPDQSGKEPKPYYENRFALMNIRIMATANIMRLGGKLDYGIQKLGPEAIALMKTLVVAGDEGYPNTTAKSAYHSDVLDVWTDLGGKLKFSRHPNTGKIKGPLVRYFSAVTQPVQGGSPESIPDIIERHVARKSALEKWQLDAAKANEQP